MKRIFDGIRERDIKTLRWIFLFVGMIIVVSLIIFRPEIPKIFWNFTTSFFNSSVNMTGSVVKVLLFFL